MKFLPIIEPVKWPFKVHTKGFRVPVLIRKMIGCKSVNLYPEL